MSQKRKLDDDVSVANAKNALVENSEAIDEKALEEKSRIEKVQSWLQQDKHLLDYVQKISAGLLQSSNFVLDDHWQGKRVVKVKNVMFVQKQDIAYDIVKKEFLWINKRRGHNVVDENVWCCLFPSRFKNPLYTDEHGAVHVSEPASGMELPGREYDLDHLMMHKDDEIQYRVFQYQVIYGWNEEGKCLEREENVWIPIEKFHELAASFREK